MRTLAMVTFLFVVAGLPNARPAGAADVRSHVVRADRHSQTVDHFGAADCWTTNIFAHWSDAGRRRVADLLFTTDRGIALSMWRFNPGAGVQTPHRIPRPLNTADTFETGPGTYDWTRLPAEPAATASRAA